MQENYSAHTCIVVDLQAKGFPITTLGVKLIDAHVNDLGRLFILAEDFSEEGDGGGGGGEG